MPFCKFMAKEQTLLYVSDFHREVWFLGFDYILKYNYSLSLTLLVSIQVFFIPTLNGG